MKYMLTITFTVPDDAVIEPYPSGKVSDLHQFIAGVSFAGQQACLDEIPDTEVTSISLTVKESA